MRLIPTILTVIMALAPSCLAAADNPQSLPHPTVAYSAKRVIESEHGTLEGEVFYTPPHKERNQMEVQGMSSAVIMRRDLGVMWVLTAQGTYLEQELDAANTLAGLGDEIEIVEFSEEGTDLIDGQRTRRYLVVTRSGGDESRGKLWLSSHNIPIRMELQVNSAGQTMDATIQVTDLEIGPQPDSLFEIPAGYTKVNTSTGLAGGVPGATGAEGPGRAGSWTSALADAAEQAAKEAAKQEVKRKVKKKVRKGLRSIFN